MNTLRNNVSLIGNLGRDPEITEFGKNRKVAKFSIATNDAYKNKSGDWVEQTTWHNIIAWDDLADRCAKMLKKGNQIVLQGKLTNDSYESKEGEKRYVTQVTLRNFEMMNWKMDGNTSKS